MLRVLTEITARLRHWAVRRHPEAMWPKLLKLSFLAAFVIGQALEGWLSELPIFQVAALRLTEDLIQQAQQQNARVAERVTLVPVDQQDRSHFFEDRYPLNSAALAEAVWSLSQLGPTVIVVDVDTDHVSFKGLSEELSARIRPGTKVVWARRLDESADGKISSRNVLHDVASDVQLSPNQSSGLAGVERSFDWSIRRYQLGWYVEGVGWRRSLHYEAVCQFCDSQPRLCEKLRTYCKAGEPLPEPATPSLHHYYSFDSLPLRAVYDMSRSPDARETLANRVAVLGIPDSPSDMHHTVFGERPGMWLVASAVERELSPTPDLQLSWFQHKGFEIALALAIVFVHSRFRPQAALLLTLGMLGGLVYFGAWLAVRFAGYDASVMPFLMGILLEQITSSAERAQDLEEHQSAVSEAATGAL